MLYEVITINVMGSLIKTYLVTVLILSSFTLFAQRETNKWKAQLALGVNSPSQSGFVDNFEAKSINFPTVNLGVQTMFKQHLGAKLDFGFNRMSSEDSSPRITSYNVCYTKLLRPDFYFILSSHNVLGTKH